MITFQQFVEAANQANNTQKTQVSTTGSTYQKTGEYLRGYLPSKNALVLSHGAGLDHTKPALKAGLGSLTHVVHDFEPYPSRRKIQPEFTDAKKIPKNKYDAVVSHNVLNVLEPEERENALHSIFNSVKPGGHLVIGTRKWRGDVETAKNTEPGPEPNSVWVKKGSERSYQKGFDGDELKDHIEDFASRHGHVVTVKRLNKIAANGVHVQVHSKGK